LSLKQYEDSLLVFFEALAIRKAETKDLVLPEDIEESQLKLAKVLNNIGCVNYEMGKFQEGKEHFEKSIRLQKNALGELNVFSFTDPTKRPGFLTLASTMCNKGRNLLDWFYQFPPQFY
jgi:tetratricopeptide (TPR) repeat protein